MAALEGLNRPEAGDSTAAVVAPGTTRGALHTSAVAPSLARRPLFGQILGFVQAQGATSGAQRSRAGDTGPAAGASSSAADQAGAAACVTTAAAGQPGASVRAPPAGAGQPGAYAGAPPPGAVQPGSSAGALPAGARLPGASAIVSPAAAGAGVFAPQAGGVQPGASALVAPAGPSGHALHRSNLLFHGSGHPTVSVHLPLSSHGPGVQESPAFLFSAEALDTSSILPGHTSSAPRGTLLNMPSQQVLPSPAASSSFMPSTQVGEEEEAASKRFTGVTKKKGKNEWVARIVLDRNFNSLIVISSHFQCEVAAARSIAAASHVMFVDNPTRGDLIPLTDVDRARLQGCTAQQCELMVRQKFWHKWEQWAEYWPAVKAKYDEKERKAAMKRAALDRSLGQPGGRPDKMARTVGEGLSRGVTGGNDECVGSKDE
ncbi:unnamed protein product [Closterium sp. Naga37s-1]|nr:unnamed protein product [Closterium sp. Naga37s-1]